MAIYSEANSFFQLNNPINFNCVEPVNTCLPVYEEIDLWYWSLMTDNNPSGLITYYYRLVANCSMPVDNTLDGIIPFESHQINPTKWLLSPLNSYEEPTVLPLGFDAFECGQCMYLQIIKREIIFYGDVGVATNSIAGCIGCFQKVCDPCYTTKMTYRNNENAFGLTYTGTDGVNSTLDEFYFNKVRLPFYLKQPQFPTKRTVFNLSNGTQKKLSSRIEKEWSCETDYMPKEWHEKLVVALEHDFVSLENTNANVNSEFMNESNYEVDWQSFLNYPTAQAKFKLKQIPYNNVNSNCL